MALTLVLNDTFVEETEDTALISHTPDVGIGWNVLANSGSSNATVDAATDSLNKPFYSGAESGYVIDVAAAQDDNQAAELTVNGTAVIAPAIQLQNDTTGISCYYAWYDTGANHVRLSRYDNGTPTVLASYFQAEGASDKIKIEGNSSGDLEVWLNDVSVITHNDTTYTGGLPGLWADNPALDDAADNFTAWMGEAGAGDTTAPTFSVAPAVSAITQTTADLDATIDETGDIFWVAVPQADPDPTDAEVIAGQSSGGGSPEASGSALAGTVLDTQITGLTSGSDYTVHLIARDDEPTPNVQAATTKVNFSTAAAAGTVTTEEFSNNTGTDQVNLTDLWAFIIDPVNKTVPAIISGQSNDASGVMSVSDAAIVPGNTYAVVTLNDAGTVAGIEFITAT